MTAIWSSTCKLRKPGDGAEAVVRLGFHGLSEVWASAGLTISGTLAAPEEPQEPSMLGEQGENKLYDGNNIACPPYFIELLK